MCLESLGVSDASAGDVEVADTALEVADAAPEVAANDGGAKDAEVADVVPDGLTSSQAAREPGGEEPS